MPNKVPDWYLYGTALDDVLRSFGVLSGSSCSEKIVEKAIEDYKKEAEVHFLKILEKIGTNVVKETINLLSGVLTASSYAVLSKISNIISNFYSNILNAYLIYLTPQFIIFFLRYVASKFLKNYLDKRIYLCTQLELEIDHILDTLQLLLNIIQKEKDSLDNVNFEKIIYHIEEAQKIIGVEINNLYNADFNKYEDKYVVNKYNLKLAVQHIENAINLLTNDFYYSQVLTNIQQIENNKDINDQKPIFTEPNSLYNYYINVFKKLKNKYENKSSEELIQKFAPIVFKQFPDTFKFLFILSAVFNSAYIIATFTPIYIKKFLDRLLRDKIKRKDKHQNYFLTDYLNKIINELNIYSDNYIDKEKNIKNYIGDYTLERLTTLIKYYETILVFSIKLYNYLSEISYEFYNNLVESFNDLNSVKNDIINFPKDSYFELQLKKFVWITNLEKAKFHLEPITGNYTGFRTNELGSEYINSVDILDFNQKIEEKSDKLRSFIKEKYNSESPIEPAEIFISESQKSFWLFTNEFIFMLGSYKIQNLIEKLQSLKFLLRKQIEMDVIEYNLASSVVSTAESHPVFPFLDHYFQKLQDTAEKLKLDTISQALKEGDLIKLADYTNTAFSYINSVNIFSNSGCVEDTNLFNDIISRVNINTPKFQDLENLKKIQNEIDQSTQYLKQKESLINKIINIFKSNSKNSDKTNYPTLDPNILYDIGNDTIKRLLEIPYV